MATIYFFFFFFFCFLIRLEKQIRLRKANSRGKVYCYIRITSEKENSHIKLITEVVFLKLREFEKKNNDWELDNLAHVYGSLSLQKVISVVLEKPKGLKIETNENYFSANLYYNRSDK